MNRRKFLAYSVAAGIGAVLYRTAGAASADVWEQDFSSAAASNPYLQGYRGATQEFATDDIPIEGKIPAALRGTFYRNGPALHELGGMRHHHWFDGDGMVQAFRFSDPGVSHIGRFVETRKHVKETQAGKFLYNSYGTEIANSLALTSPDDVNVANTSVLPHAGELLALYEGGSAYQLQPRSLDTIGPKVWRADLKGMPFSAHPKVDPAGVMWNFGLNVRMGAIVLYQISPQGDLVKATVVQAPGLVNIHDFAITPRHLVFLVPPMRFNVDKFIQGRSVLDSQEWIDGAPMRVLVVDKADMKTYRFFELPSGFVFHFGNAWQDDAGMIRFDYVRLPDASTIAVDMREVMRGKVMARNVSETHLVTLNLKNGKATQERIPGIVEFPRVDPRVVGRRYRNLYLTARTTETSLHRGASAIERREIETGKVDTFDYGGDYLAEEHIVVAKPGEDREGAGWLIGTALDVRRRCTVLSIFDALDLKAGPIARATLPYALPLGFHGNFSGSV